MNKLNTAQTQWDLSPLFASDTDSTMEQNKKEVAESAQKFITKWKERDDYLSDPKVLTEALTDYEKWATEHGTYARLDYYFSLRTSQDENNTELKAQENKITEIATKLSNEMQFFSLRLAKVPIGIQEKFLAYPTLAPFKHYLARLFAEKKYLLSEPEEKILNLKSQPSYGAWVRMTASFLSKEKRQVTTEDNTTVEKSFSEIASLASDKNKTLRDSAAHELNDIFKKYIEVGENEMNAILGNKKIDDELRGAERPDTFRHLSDDLDSSVVDALVETVSAQNEIARNYYALKAKLMGVKKLAYHERNVEYTEINKKYSYDEAVNLVYKVFTNLDSEFAEIFKMFVEKGQIDAFPYSGKRSGAFCAHQLITQPTYILLNHTNKLNDVLTIAHEAGHGINNELIRKKQNALNFGTPTSTAEVASTFMEDFVLQELIKEARDDLQLSLMVSKLNDDISSIFRQIAFYKFEWDMHAAYREKGYLSKEEIGSLFRKNMESYMGDAVEQSEGSENWWLYVPHFRYFFYVYSYSGGLLISKSLQKGVKNDPTFINKVKEFLSAGLSDSPKNIFAKMEIDITDKKFWENGLLEIQQLLVETENLAKKLKKI
jgi:oligoendopeptidase F